MDRSAPFASVAGLLFGRSPAAISWLVVAVIVDAVEAMFGARASVHIGKKVDVIAPSFTNGDAATSVMLPLWVFWVAATIQHAAPRSIFWCLGFPLFVSPLAVGPFTTSETLVSIVTAKASAGQGSSLSEKGAGGEMLSSAIAETSPFLTVFEIFHGNKSPEPLARNVNEGDHCNRIAKESELCNG